MPYLTFVDIVTRGTFVGPVAIPQRDVPVACIAFVLPVTPYALGGTFATLWPFVRRTILLTTVRSPRMPLPAVRYLTLHDVALPALLVPAVRSRFDYIYRYPDLFTFSRSYRSVM